MAMASHPIPPLGRGYKATPPHYENWKVVQSSWKLSRLIMVQGIQKWRSQNLETNPKPRPRPSHQNWKVVQSSLKFVQTLILVLGNKKWRSQNLKTDPWPRPRPSPQNLKSVTNELQIGTKTNFGTWSLKMIIPKSENQLMTTPMLHPSK